MSYLRTVIIESVAFVGSLGTLICCALPAVLISLGAGAAVASVVTNVPQLGLLSEHKTLLFTLAGIMLLISGVTTYLNGRAPCPVDPVGAKLCKRVRRFAVAVFISSVALYLIGFYFAFIAARFAA